MDPKLVAALVGLIVELTLLVKLYRDVLAVKQSRMETKIDRDKDSMELHDKILKHDFMIAQLRDQQSLTATVVDDLRDQCSTLNTNIVKLDTNITNLADAVRELRQK